MSLNPLLKGLPAVHPGEILRDIVVPGLGISKVAVAGHLGINRSSLYDLFEGATAVTAPMALRLGKLCGNGPEFWMSLQANYDLTIAQRELASEIEAIPTLAGAA